MLCFTTTWNASRAIGESTQTHPHNKTKFHPIVFRLRRHVAQTRGRLRRVQHSWGRAASNNTTIHHRKMFPRTKSLEAATTARTSVDHCCAPLCISVCFLWISVPPPCPPLCGSELPTTPVCGHLWTSEGFLCTSMHLNGTLFTPGNLCVPL